MTDPISSTNRAFETCDPGNASCAAPASAAPPPAPSAKSITLAPVVITGDAGAQELMRRYDSDKCTAPRQTAVLSCPAIGLGVLSLARGGDPIASIATALHASVTCGKDLRAFYDCREQNESLKTSAAEVVAGCHERDGTVKPGSSLNEIVCEVPR